MVSIPLENDNIVVKIVGAYCIRPYKISSITLRYNSKLVSESKLTSFVALLCIKSKLVSFDSLNQYA